MAQLRVGLIGYGTWEREAYVSALRRDCHARIVSAAALSEGTRKRIRQELGCRWTYSMDSSGC